MKIEIERDDIRIDEDRTTFSIAIGNLIMLNINKDGSRYNIPTNGEKEFVVVATEIERKMMLEKGNGED